MKVIIDTNIVVSAAIADKKTLLNTTIISLSFSQLLV
jgi:predicted nucleic acid-binding protein